MSATTSATGAISPQFGSMPASPTTVTATGITMATAAAVRILRFARFVMRASVRHA